MDKLECPVCMCLFEEPVSLLCGHSVCMDCAASLKHTHNVIFQRSPQFFKIFKKISQRGRERERERDGQIGVSSMHVPIRGTCITPLWTFCVYGLWTRREKKRYEISKTSRKRRFFIFYKNDHI